MLGGLHLYSAYLKTIFPVENKVFLLHQTTDTLNFEAFHSIHEIRPIVKASVQLALNLQSCWKHILVILFLFFAVVATSEETMQSLLDSTFVDDLYNSVLIYFYFIDL